jgi:hypothetical protein
MVTEAQVEKVVAWWRTVAKLGENRRIVKFVPNGIGIVIIKRARELEREEGYDGKSCVGGRTYSHDLIQEEMDSPDGSFDTPTDYCFVLGSIPESQMEWVKKGAKRVWTLDASDNVVQIHGAPMRLIMDGSRLVAIFPV